MQTHFKLPARAPMWIAGISICLMAVTGIVAFARSIPASSGNIPDQGASSKQGGAPRGFADTDAKDPAVPLTVERAAINRQYRAGCAECGVVESMREIGRPGDAGGQTTVGARVAGGVSGTAIAASAIAGKGYEFTVRFRDGSTTVFTEATPRTWRLGTRVMVIGRSNASNS